ncbi:MAG: NAD(P)-dependent methylenetetrahydromethanopterin dehydrogenase [Hyphomicrobiales bacterium]
MPEQRDKHILHMITPLKHMSPFDVNMATDAGFDVIATYTGVETKEVQGLVQDAIFSRHPRLSVNTGLFIGGRDALAALDMIDIARKSLVPPFELSIFADPAGSFTTAAAMVACVEKVLKDKCGKDLKGLRVAVFGATGVVGFSSGVIAAGQGAKVTLVGHDGVARVEKAGQEIKNRFHLDVAAADGSNEAAKEAVVKNADVVFACARAGTQVLSAAQLKASPSLLVAADVNAVPPPGLQGLDVMANGVAFAGSHVLGVGPLTIGNVKYQTEFGLFRRMIESDKPVCFDFREAFELARTLTV